MPENPAKPAPPPDAGHVPITEEFDSPKWTLPPVIPIVIGLAIVLVVIGVLVFGAKAKPGGSGGITGVYAVDLKNQPGVLAIVQVHMSNIGEQPMWIKSASVTIETDLGKWTDQAAAPMDFKRYFEAYPELKQYEKPPIAAETKIAPGGQLDGMILVGYPPPPEPNATTPPINFGKEQFDKRKSLTVDIDLYDRRPLQLKEKR
ncbi:MAG TPA: hypothetical protein VMS96_09855 [Terriglobales bacterium]|nr:hypothetical protein [Terriglobales bacterium]